MASILEIHKAKTGKVADKWLSYLELYDRLFAKFQSSPISMVEIGIANGGSLDTWAEYFPNAKEIIGLDVNERCRNLVYPDPRIKVHIQDGKTSIPGNYDIIIDDGSHTSHDIIEQFKAWFPYLNDGGIYVVEDIHTMWHLDGNSGWGRGAEMFFANMINDVNREFHKGSAYPVRSVEFHNSIVVVHKGDSLLKDRLICGNEFNVNPRYA